MRSEIPKRKAPQTILSPNLLLPIAILGIVIVIASMYLGYQSRKRDYTRLLENQATLFVKTLANTAQNAFTAAGELEEEISSRMIASLHLIEQLDRVQTVSSKKLRELLPVAQFDEIQIYNRNAGLVKIASVDSIQRQQVPKTVLWPALKRDFQQMIYTFPETENLQQDQLAAMIPREKGGIIAGIVDADRIRAFRRMFGFGQFLKQFQTGESVKYIVLENPQTIVAGIFSGYEISSFSDDPFLGEALREAAIKTRVLNYPGHGIFEAVAPFNFGGEPFGVLRLGLSMKEYEALEAQSWQRFLIFGGVLMILGLIFLSFVRAYQHRQHLRQDLAQLQAYMSTILENLASGVISINRDGNIQVVNKHAAALLAQDSQQFYNQHYTMLPEPFVKTIDEFFATKSENTSSKPHQFTFGNSGRRYAIKTTLLSENHPQTYILMVDDITDQTRLEEQLRRNEKLAAMRKLASTVAHEIRNPLNSINLIIDLIKKKYSPAEDQEIYHRNLKTVQGEITRISDIVEEFINFARLPKLKFVAIDFSVFFAEITALTSAKLEAAGITANYDLQSHPEFLGDPEQLKQVFLNLIQNASEAMAEAGSITIKGKLKKTAYEISVTDTGSGISPENLPQIFDLSFTTKKHGNGIGLAVVHQIISNHNGTIEVESTEGSGTTFYIRLPFVKNNRTQI